MVDKTYIDTCAIRLLIDLEAHNFFSHFKEVQIPQEVKEELKNYKEVEHILKDLIISQIKNKPDEKFLDICKKVNAGKGEKACLYHASESNGNILTEDFKFIRKIIFYKNRLEFKGIYFIFEYIFKNKDKLNGTFYIYKELFSKALEKGNYTNILERKENDDIKNQILDCLENYGLDIS
ncbi:MAG: hypothetical protein AABX38_01385 [Candidatus Micrarchaeota archaeon]